MIKQIQINIDPTLKHGYFRSGKLDGKQVSIYEMDGNLAVRSSEIINHLKERTDLGWHTQEQYHFIDSKGIVHPAPLRPYALNPVEVKELPSFIRDKGIIFYFDKHGKELSSATNSACDHILEVTPPHDAFFCITRETINKKYPQQYREYLYVIFLEAWRNVINM